MEKYKVNLNDEFWAQFGKDTKKSQEQLHKAVDELAKNPSKKLEIYRDIFHGWRTTLAVIEKRMGYVPVCLRDDGYLRDGYLLDVDAIINLNEYTSYLLWPKWIYTEEITISDLVNENTIVNFDNLTDKQLVLITNTKIICLPEEVYIALMGGRSD